MSAILFILTGALRPPADIDSVAKASFTLLQCQRRHDVSSGGTMITVLVPKLCGNRNVVIFSVEEAPQSVGWKSLGTTSGASSDVARQEVLSCQDPKGPGRRAKEQLGNRTFMLPSLFTHRFTFVDYSLSALLSAKSWYSTRNFHTGNTIYNIDVGRLALT